MEPNFPGLKALFLNCSLKQTAAESNTQKLLDRAAAIMTTQGVDVETVHLREHQIAFGMVKDATESGAAADDWPQIQEKIMQANILVVGTPIWLGVKSSLATLAIERMYAYSGDRNASGQYLYYGKAGGCVITGNEDGIKHCAMDILYALQHIGYVVPPQADCGWIGEAGPGPSYGQEVDGEIVGYNNDFTNRNTTFMAWNLMHQAQMLVDAGGFPSVGNQPEEWQNVTNAKDQNPEYR